MTTAEFKGRVQEAMGNREGASLNWCRTNDHNLHFEVEIGGTWSEPCVLHETDVIGTLGDAMTERIFSTMQEPQIAIYDGEVEGPVMGWSLELGAPPMREQKTA